MRCPRFFWALPARAVSGLGRHRQIPGCRIGRHGQPGEGPFLDEFIVDHR